MVSIVKGSLSREYDVSEVEIRYSESSSVYLDADKGLMSQAFFNLLRNSLDAIDRGVISIHAQQKKRAVQVRIEDPGMGIPEEDQERIFEPFFSTKKKGMGVGLYLTKKIIEAHEGKIEVRSQKGQGTVFVIRVPGG